MKINLDIINAKYSLLLSMEEIAKILGVSKEQLDNWLINPKDLPDIYAEKLHEYCHSHGFRPNECQLSVTCPEMNFVDGDTHYLFHSVEQRRKGRAGRKFLPSLEKGDQPGLFSLQTDYRTAALLSAENHCPYWYFYALDAKDLTYEKMDSILHFAYARAYFKGWLEERADHPFVRQIVNPLKKADYVIVPQTNEAMDDLIKSFANGEITDLQCQNALNQYRLGMRYVIMSEKGMEHLRYIREFYSSHSEVADYQKFAAPFLAEGKKKAKEELIQYRGNGLYIDELMR